MIIRLLLIVISVSLISSCDVFKSSENKSIENNLSGSDSVIVWSDTVELRLSDFWKEKPQLDNYSLGEFYSSLITDSDTINGEFVLNIRNCFFRNESWVEDTNLMLKSEQTRFLEIAQTRFDLNEVFARRVRKKVSELKPKGNFDLQWFLIEDITIDESGIRDAKSNQFDKDIFDDVEGEKLEKWKEKVNVSLLEYGSFTDSIVRVKW